MSEHRNPEPYVLVADDDPLMLKSVGIILRGAGYRVVTVRDGAAALEQMRREKPRVAFLDVMMGQINGLDLCRTIKADADLADIQVFLLSARAMLRERREGLAAGADDYITKPFANRDLVDRVKQVFTAEATRAPGVGE